MILLAESGSTKTQWCLIEKEKIKQLTNTSGINPLLLSQAEIETIVRPQLANVEKPKLELILYYGAGCAVPEAIEKVKNALLSVFDCQNIQVDTDLKAACLALANDRPGIIGLLGTGSNSCVWDGQMIKARIPSLGYILGDEGGGVGIGKQLVRDFIKKEMPQHIHLKFFEIYKLETAYVLDRVYHKKMPNKFLAGFAPFVEKHIDEAYCRNMLWEQFESYLQLNILKYTEKNSYPLFFCGSIAYHHRDILERVCKSHGLHIENVSKAPISELATYIQKKYFLV